MTSWRSKRILLHFPLKEQHHSYGSSGEFQHGKLHFNGSPKHDVQRMSVTGVVAPVNLAKLGTIIRERACNILDDLPIDEPFNWVDEVSIELTTQMLATLFDFPYEDRYRLTYWSDMATSSELQGGPTPESERQAALRECWKSLPNCGMNESRDPNDSFDLITMMALNRDMQNMDPLEYLGNLILLIVGGNDTTRNSLTVAFTS